MSKRVFVSISLQRGTKNDQVTNVTNGLGYSKGIRVKGRRSLPEGGAEAGKAASSGRGPGAWSQRLKYRIDLESLSS